MDNKTPLWIAPQLQCGLGNRLFQTIAAIGEAERRESQPVLFLPRSGQVEHGEIPFYKELFNHLKVIETTSSWKEVQELTDGSIPPFNSHQEPVILKGFFQNTTTFPSFSNPNWPQLPLTPRYPTRWAVHFRLGDYSILPHHQAPNIAFYYGYCIQTFIPKGSEILLVSDSSKALLTIQKELQDWGYHSYIFETESAKETFLEVSRCGGGLIGSNSTFAWWMAYFLWKNTGAVSYFPPKWFGDGRPNPELFNTPFTRVPVVPSSAPPLKSFCY